MSSAQSGCPAVFAHVGGKCGILHAVAERRMNLAGGETSFSSEKEFGFRRQLRHTAR